jgi:hypothetical protein
LLLAAGPIHAHFLPVDSSPDGLSAALAGRYRVERELGVGGMATVYLAHDVRHERRVAIKILHPELAAALGVDRFLAEIKVTANLQHPNILPLLDSGLIDSGVPYYVMPYVEGESLRARLDRERQLPLAEAVTIAKGVAAALGYAHKQGVIHRDIKPENILLQDGHPLVADFGIALAVTMAGGQRLTQTGLSLGTPHYMSPEQAMGERQIDARTDVYALGVVVYEMLAGEPPFTGPNAPAVVAKVLTEKPRSLATLRDTVPSHIDAAVQQALQKLPADRFGSVTEFASALSDPAFSGQHLSDVRAPDRAARKRTQVRASTVAPWLVTAAAMALAVWAFKRPVAIADREQWDLVAPDSAPIALEVRRAYSPPAISPDGTLLVYTAARDSSTMLYITRLGAGDTRPLVETHGGYAPFFSPDGSQIGFLTENQIRRVDATTGKASVIREGIEAHMGTWTSSERIAFMDAGGYGWIDADGTGDVKRTSLRPFMDPARPWPGVTAIPGTDQILVSDAELRVAVVTLSDGSVLYLTSGEPSATPPPLDEALLGVWPRFVAPNYIVLWRPGAKLLAVRFDPGSLRVSGKPVEIQRGVRVSIAGVSPGGTWAYAPSLAAGGSVLVNLEDGRERTYSLQPRRYQGISLSPDGQQIATRIMSESGRELLEAYDLAHGAVLTERIDGVPGWTTPQWDPSGRYLYVSSPSGTVHRKETRSSAHDSSIVRLAGGETFELEGVIGGDTLVTTIGKPGQRDIFYVQYHDLARRIPLVQRDGDQFQAAISPSGRWLAYSVIEGGVRVLIVEPRTGSGERLRIGEGLNYIWDLNDGLYFVADGFVNRRRVTMGPDGPTADTTVRLMRAPSFAGESGQTFAPVGGGRSLMALMPTAPDAAKHLVVIRHWEKELARLVR